MNHSIVITSDSTCDLGERLIAKRGVVLYPLSVMLGAKTFRDGIDIVPDDIFRYFNETGDLPKTAAPSATSSRGSRPTGPITAAAARQARAPDHFQGRS